MKTLILLISVILLSSCATMFGEKNRLVMITSNPSGANVEYSGHDIGTTPTEIKVKNTFNPNFVTVSKPKYHTLSKQITSTFQTVGLLNIFWWPGFVIDAVTGDMMMLDQHQMNFVLKPE